MRLQYTVLIFATFVGLRAAPGPGAPGEFEELAAYRGRGGLVASLIGPGPSEGSERLYLSYIYDNYKIDIISVDPDTSSFRVFSNPTPGEFGARCIVVGQDNKIYLGTLPNAHLLQLDPHAGTLVDLGRPSQTESYIWDVTAGPDGKIYGATYPGAKLVRYDPISGKLDDLGRMDPTEQYAHSVIGTDDFLYIGIGTSRANIAAYQISTGEHHEILPVDAQVVGTAVVYIGQDGEAYGMIGSRKFRLKGWVAASIESSEAVHPIAVNRLRDGRKISVKDDKLVISGLQAVAASERPFVYEGNFLPIFRLGIGPDSRIYASSILPIHLLRLSVGMNQFEELGVLGGGEIYSFLAHRDLLLMSAYGGVAPLMTYDPGKPFHPGENPGLVHYPDEDGGWRPQAMIEGADGRIYLAALAGYGRLGGPLTVWNLHGNGVTSYFNVIHDESVISLALNDGIIVGGTTIAGGGGSHRTQKEAHLFLWDPRTSRKIFDGVPVPGASSVNDLVATPDNLVYGIADRTLFVFDPVSGVVRSTAPLPFRGEPYNSAAIASDGNIWGLAGEGIFRIDTRTHGIALVAKSPEPITAGFAFRGNEIFFASKAKLYRFRLPEHVHPSAEGLGPGSP